MCFWVRVNLHIRSLKVDYSKKGRIFSLFVCCIAKTDKWNSFIKFFRRHALLLLYGFCFALTLNHDEAYTYVINVHASAQTHTHTRHIILLSKCCVCVFRYKDSFIFMFICHSFSFCRLLSICCQPFFCHICIDYTYIWRDHAENQKKKTETDKDEDEKEETMWNILEWFPTMN